MERAQTHKRDAAEVADLLALTIRLRWAGLAVGLLSVSVIYFIRTPLVEPVFVAPAAAFVVIYNILASVHCRLIRRHPRTYTVRRTATVFAAYGLLDLVALSVGIYLTDGVQSRYLFMLLVYVLLVSVVSSPRAGYVVATVASLLVLVVDLLESIPLEQAGGVSNGTGAVLFGTIEVMEPATLLLFSCTLYLGVYVISYVTARLRLEHRRASMLFRDQERTMAQLSALQQIGTEISSLAELDTVLALIVKKANELFATDMAFLALREESCEDIRVTVTYGKDAEPLKGVKLGPGQGMGGQVMIAGYPMTVRDYATDPRLIERPLVAVSQVPLGSGMAAPLSIGQRRIGVLYVFNREKTGFDPSDAEMLMALANQAAIAIENVKLYVDLREAAITDGLTGLYNSRYLREQLPAEVARLERYGGKLAMVMADCDFLKEVNDGYGHHVGDQLLVHLGGMIKDSVRGTDIVTRYGGDEFVVLLLEADRAEALQIAERMRTTIEHSPLLVEGKEIRVTVSLGIATYPDDARSAEDLSRKADNALYMAKSLGKNMISTAQPIL